MLQILMILFEFKIHHNFPATFFQQAKRLKGLKALLALENKAFIFHLFFITPVVQD